MAEKFKRPGVTKKGLLYAKYSAALNEGGFLDEDLYTTRDRDIKEPILKMLSNTNAMSTFSKILVAYRKVDYSEQIIQQLEFESLDAKNMKGNTYAMTHPMDIEIYEMIWMNTPYENGKVDEVEKLNGKRVYSGVSRLVKPKKAIIISNTLDYIEDVLEKDYTICENVREFLANLLAKQSVEESVKTDANLIYMDLKNDVPEVTYQFFPLLKDNMYYEDAGGNKRYPYITECYNYHKTRENQIKFHIKEIVRSSDRAANLIESYFTVGRPKDFEEEIFVIKQFGINFYNPFSFLDDTVAERLYHKILQNPILTIETQNLLRNTYDHYLYMSDLRKEYGLAVPALNIVESSVKSLRVNSEGDPIYDMDAENDVQLDEDFEGSYTIPDPSEEEQRSKTIRQSKGYSTVDSDTIESVIMGYNGVRCFGYYNHLNEYLIRVFVFSSSGKKRFIKTKTNPFPRHLQTVATVKQNADMFTTMNITHPFDAYAASVYKKYLYFTPKDKSKSTDHVNPAERYRDYETEYGLIDSITVKSEETCGLVAYLLPYKRNSHRIILRTRGAR